MVLRIHKYTKAVFVYNLWLTSLLIGNLIEVILDFRLLFSLPGNRGLDTRS